MGDISDIFPKIILPMELNGEVADKSGEFAD